MPQKDTTYSAFQFHAARQAAQGNTALGKVIERNIEAIRHLHEEAQERRSLHDRISDVITKVSGSMTFVYLHVAWFGSWIVVNLGLFGIPAFDPFPFGLLTVIVSLEAIFLSTFVLKTQSRQAAIAHERNNLDLQVNLLAEYELTRTLVLVDAIASHLGLEVAQDSELNELEEHVHPHKLHDEIEKANSKD